MNVKLSLNKTYREWRYIPLVLHLAGKNVSVSLHPRTFFGTSRHFLTFCNNYQYVATRLMLLNITMHRISTYNLRVVVARTKEAVALCHAERHTLLVYERLH